MWFALVIPRIIPGGKSCILKISKEQFYSSTHQAIFVFLMANAIMVAITIANVIAAVRGNSGMPGISASVGVVVSKGGRVGVGAGESVSDSSCLGVGDGVDGAVVVGAGVGIGSKRLKEN